MINNEFVNKVGNDVAKVVTQEGLFSNRNIPFIYCGIEEPHYPTQKEFLEEKVVLIVPFNIAPSMSSGLARVPECCFFYPTTDIEHVKDDFTSQGVPYIVLTAIEISDNSSEFIPKDRNTLKRLIIEKFNLEYLDADNGIEWIARIDNSDLKQKTFFPFGGFYESIHEYLINMGIENLTMRDDGESLVTTEELLNFNYIPLYTEYCEKLIQFLNSELNTSIEYIGVWSPKEYNFETDEIEVGISLSDIRKIAEYLKEEESITEEEFSECIKENLLETVTPRSGYIPPYKYLNDLKGIRKSFFHVAGAVFDVFVDKAFVSDKSLFEDWREHYLEDVFWKSPHIAYLEDLVNSRRGTDE